MASASSSEKTPARQAATYSPMLWPTMAGGSTPSDIHQRASEYSMENRAGCVSQVWFSFSAAASFSSCDG